MGVSVGVASGVVDGSSDGDGEDGAAAPVSSAGGVTPIASPVTQPKSMLPTAMRIAANSGTVVRARCGRGCGPGGGGYMGVLSLR
ncbi:hypothetical protein BJF79_27510 [Actinomadura sp. CNU-125]|uniref:hypothetical protein n=1 Tax=Actinomadura sp. CNU-125 TaxID=1904961 RepID=UPI00095DCEFC|nr:hypothetical protein [Actinomadura sp. CNU-125]OLT38286.1 hypothetical protein BJF79_27510 [Actinomadura sp. CNU-125]